MPVKRRIPKVRRSDMELTPQIQLALEGRDYFGVFHSSADPVGEKERLQDAWDAFGEEITAAWVADHPGSRPWGWWQFNAPEPRRRHIGGALPLCDEPDSPVTVCESLSYGICSSSRQAQALDPPIYESEAEYLSRHGLLGAAERQAIGTVHSSSPIAHPRFGKDATLASLKGNNV